MILIAGSAQLVQTLIEHGLVDELRLMVFPVIVGSGKRLFGDTNDKHGLKLDGLQDRRRRSRDPHLPPGLRVVTHRPRKRTSARANSHRIRA